MKSNIFIAYFNKDFDWSISILFSETFILSRV